MFRASLKQNVHKRLDVKPVLIFILKQGNAGLTSQIKFQHTVFIQGDSHIFKRTRRM